MQAPATSVAAEATPRAFRAVVADVKFREAQRPGRTARFGLDGGDPDPQRPSAAVRSLALATPARVLEVALEDLSTYPDRRGRRIRVLRVRRLESPLVLSLSHHGRFASWHSPVRCLHGPSPEALE